MSLIRYYYLCMIISIPNIYKLHPYRYHSFN